MLVVALWGAAEEAPRSIEVRLPIDPSRQIDVGEFVAKVASATAVTLARPMGELRVPVIGVGGSLSRATLSEILGPDARLDARDGALVVTVDPRVLEADRRPEWKERLGRLAEHVEREAQRRSSYGMSARSSYRPNDPARPTVCLVHGLNSSSGGFRFMIRPIEEAGYGVVVYDYPYNQDLTVSCAEFARDWKAFRQAVGERRPWAIVAHSMGALVARSYVEDPRAYAGDVSTLILVAPVNQGSTLAKAHTFLQLLGGVQAVNNKKTSEALARLGDGLGEAAKDILPGSAFLTELNRRPRREGVAYHIVAGDSGFLTAAARKQLEDRIARLQGERGLLGGLTRIATADLSSRLDELSDGYGDGGVSVASTRLEGVTDHVVIHANHAELIRAPLLFNEPGFVPCMPYLLRWLGEKPPPASEARRSR